VIKKSLLKIKDHCSDLNDPLLNDLGEPRILPDIISLDYIQNKLTSGSTHSQTVGD